MDLLFMNHHKKLTVSQLVEYWQYTGQKEVLMARQMPSWYSICDELYWEEWNVNSYEIKYVSGKGIYRLVGIESDPTLATITRLGGEDRTGTLYLGKSAHLSRRLGNLVRSLSVGPESHRAAISINESHILKVRFPPDKLRIRVYKHEKTKEIESDLVKAYLKEFADTPPLNCSI